MKDRSEFVEITEATAFGVRDMLRTELNKITNGRIAQAIKLVQELLEMEEICARFNKDKDKELILPVSEMPTVKAKYCKGGIIPTDEVGMDNHE